MSTLGFSGKDGTVYLASAELAIDVTAWKFEPSAAIAKYASNLTAGHKVGVPGVEDFKASFTTQLAKPGNMPCHVGDLVTCELHGDDTGDNYIEFDAVVSTHPIPCDINDGNPSEVEYGLEPRSRPVYHGIYASATQGSSGY